MSKQKCLDIFIVCSLIIYSNDNGVLLRILENRKNEYASLILIIRL
jgi:hypothetical protein